MCMFYVPISIYMIAQSEIKQLLLTATFEIATAIGTSVHIIVYR